MHALHRYISSLGGDTAKEGIVEARALLARAPQPAVLVDSLATTEVDTVVRLAKSSPDEQVSLLAATLLRQGGRDPDALELLRRAYEQAPSPSSETVTQLAETLLDLLIRIRRHARAHRAGGRGGAGPVASVRPGARVSHQGRLPHRTPTHDAGPGGGARDSAGQGARSVEPPRTRPRAGGARGASERGRVGAPACTRGDRSAATRLFGCARRCIGASPRATERPGRRARQRTDRRGSGRRRGRRVPVRVRGRRVPGAPQGRRDRCGAPAARRARGAAAGARRTVPARPWGAHRLQCAAATGDTGTSAPSCATPSTPR